MPQLIPRKLLPIQDIANQLNLPDEYLEPIGRYSAKISLKLLTDDARFPKKGKLILVTATTPTKAGEGKTVTGIGLGLGLQKIGKRSIVTSRQPSLGPVFGIKGGAAGGGVATVEPAEKINLHFNGDFHAITSAHNLLAAVLDAHLFHGNELDLDPERITWPRTLDMNDRALRRITVGQGTKSGTPRHTGFVITAASEIMAIVALAANLADLRTRLERIVVGFNRVGKPVTAGQLGATGGMMALLVEALMPNLVQTSEGTAATVHAGPFGNIAHGTSSVISQNMGLRLADYVVNECGFAADLGAEKYFDIVMRTSGNTPDCTVLVSSVRSLKEQGGGDFEAGFVNLRHHVNTLRKYGPPVVIAINHFPTDTAAELQRMAEVATELGVASAISDAYTKGGEGTRELAQVVVDTIEKNPHPTVKSLYSLDAPLEEKIAILVKEVYGGDGFELSDKAKDKLRLFRDAGFGQLPICIAKTQYSLSDDPKKPGAPTGWTLKVTDMNLSAGAGFIVVVCGAMMLMPGLPKLGRSLGIDVDADGKIVGVY